jgi:serine/threonine-protein kinase
MGTVGYMAPEQVRGEIADHRADVFAFGAVLYEMLSGRRAFDRPTGAETMTAILRESPPPISSLHGGPPPALERVVEHCLEKRAEDRFQSGRDLAFALSTASLDSAPSRPPGAPFASAPRARNVRLAVLGVAAVVLAGTGALLFTRSRSPRAGAAGGPHRIAVLPLLSNDKEYDFFAEGVGDAIYGQLVKVPGLVVTGRGSSAAFKGQSVDLKDVQAKLGVDAVLQGKVSRSGEKVRIALDLVKTDDASALWSGTYDGGLADTSKMQDTIVKEIATSLRLSITPGQATGQAPTSTEARDLYLRGHAAAAPLTKEGLLAAIGFYEQALEKDPKMAEAYSGIASAWSFMGDSYVSPAEAAPKAKAAALKALELDPKLAEPHFVLAYASTFYDWSVPIFLAEMKRSVELSREPQFRGGYGWALAVTGHTDEGVREMDAAVALDPLSPFLNMTREWGLYVSHRYKEILAAHQASMKENVASVYLDSFEGASLRELGRLDESIAAYERDLKLYEGTPLFGLAITYARANRMADAKKVIAALEAYRRDHYYPVELVAVACANAGELDRAFEWLDKVLETRSFIWYQLSRSPEWEPLKEDPRWAAFTKRAGVVEK